MISGRVEKRQALLPVRFRRAGMPNVTTEFVVDTGFTDALCLPTDAVRMMGFPYEFEFPGRLADGSAVMLPVHRAAIVWVGMEREVHVLATGNRPLIGTALLDGAELVIQFIEGGLVTVDTM